VRQQDTVSYWEKPEEMVEALAKDFENIFENLKWDGERVVMRVKPNVNEVTFLNGLNIALGFQHIKYVYEVEGKRVDQLADFPPQLRRGISNMYIYASICSPIQVGGVRVPLLKSIWLDVNKRNYKVGEVHAIVIKNPMYIPIVSSSINSIEVNIRSDSGRLVPFIDGSVTSLTLQFKQE